MRRLVILAIIIFVIAPLQVKANSDYMSILNQYKNTPQTQQKKAVKQYIYDKNGNKTGYIITNPDKSMFIYDMNGKLIKKTGNQNYESKKKLNHYKDIQPQKTNRRPLQNLF